jgi:hypothetical protein
MAKSTNVFYYVLYLSRFFSYNTTFNDFVVPTQENKAYSNVLLFQLILNRSILKLQYYLKILIQWSGKFQSTKVRAQNIKQWSRWSLCINLIFYIFGKSKKKIFPSPKISIDLHQNDWIMVSRPSWTYP